MKLVYAIIRNDNEDDVTSALMQEGFTVTRLFKKGKYYFNDCPSGRTAGAVY